MHIELQRVLAAGPTEADIQHWVEVALHHEQRENIELTLRIVDEAESMALNHQYRHKDYATNVLSFTYDIPAEVEIELLGDLVICAPVVQREAAEQGKSEQAHWAHMIVHGLLHLLGFDHLNDADAKEMEAHEISILMQLEFTNPYDISETEG
ncbi:Metal-dependent hydrolase YbeY, involved in rRNA and/or ribosome maturation and assembly [hydrothermal vent metagenome]|uniref:Metal-dependent hydrolase YbeY, involved in rRNA and/or ribosome maturation and assembly n=1 Tax=hydrothermal vent metagenome TaxID=652676 RepID=A0A3B1B8R0_9ZZZZ